jgi:MFS transporter, DHA1 family, tetracycline resistance protein
MLSNMRAAVVRPSIGLILASMFFTTFAFAQFESTLALLTERMGKGDRSNFFVFAYVGLVLALSQGLLVRRLVPKLGEFRMSLIGTTLMVVGLLAVAISALQNSFTSLCVALPICVIGFSALTPSLQSLLSRRSDASQQGGILGVGQGMAALARILGPVAGLKLFEKAVTYPYWCGAAVMACSILLISALRGEPSLESPGLDQPEFEGPPFE